MVEVEEVAAVHNVLGESPIWSPRERVLYWVDAEGHRFFRFAPDTGDLRTIELGQFIGCLALHERGGLILALASGITYWNDDQFKHLLSREQLGTTNRFNDGAVDRAGRFWIGTASDEPDNSLYRINLDATFQTMETGIIISNGIAFSPDNTTMYYSDSGGSGIVYAYDFDLETSTISHRRTFLPPTGTAAVADGLTVDSEGFLWIAFWDGWRIERRAPDGRLIHKIDMPVQCPTSCMFGGPDLTELYITSASRDVDRNEQPQAGNLFRIRTDVKGLPEPETTLGFSVK
ncbi:MAG: SMP-30/gluconolactonase/LRE family protein [Chloroflexi bacterium]|nr:SMP-30/gluconolactonase/LRE family protein [Chloroflexota bacterium]